MTDVETYLERVGIRFQAFDHPPVYTCEEAAAYNQEIRGIKVKNLLLSLGKGRKFFLVIAPEEERVDMKELRPLAGGRLSFARESQLLEVLGVRSGAVSPFGLLNADGVPVDLILFKAVAMSDFVSFHPNSNTRTLELETSEFRRYLDLIAVPVHIFGS